MTTALSINLYRVPLFYAMAASVALACFFAIPTPSARAADLTEPQIEAILGLLVSFDADKTTVGGVEAALRGTGEAAALEDKDTEEDIDDNTTIKNTSVAAVTKIKPVSLRQGPTCPRLAKLLRRGMRNEGPQNPDVSELQQFLAEYYGVAKEDLVTGYFGSSTERHLVRFQREEGLPAEGIAGELTRGKILRHCIKKLDGDAEKIKERVATTTPSCVLKANKREVDAGEEVTLKWESKNATHTSMPDGSRGPTKGSLQVAPTETTVYQKRVYGVGGEGTCTVEVEVKDDTDDSAPAKEMVALPLGDAFANAANVLAAAASMPFWLITDALSDMFLQIGLQ